MAKTPFKMRSGNTTAFKMMGSSPMKQDVGIQTGFGPEADAVLKEKINRKTGTSKPVVKKTGKKVVKKIAKKLGSKAIPILGWATTAYEVGKFAKDWIQTGDIEKAWDKNKWWGSEKGNLFKKDDK